MSGFFSWRGLSASIIFILVSAGVAHGEEADSFGWSITPYLWATETSVDLTFRDTNIGTGEISFSDLLDILTPQGDRIDEDPDRASNAIARVPNGGAAFDTSAYRRQSPTPGASNGEGGELGFSLWALTYPGIGGPTATATPIR